MADVSRRGALTLGALGLAGLIGGPVGFVVLFSGGGANAGSCDGGGASVDASGLPERVGDFAGEQLKNAALIMGAATSLKLPVAGQIIGVQAAIGESTLKVIDFGDGAGPDSRGLFQQRANGAWGSYTDRMDPTISATNFFKVLKGIEGWESLEPSRAINRVQRNQDPDHYTRFRAPALAIVQGLSGTAIEGGTCTDPGASVVGQLSGKWVHPLPGAQMTSGYGPRGMVGSIGGALANFHYGIDFSTPGQAGTVLAVTDMKIVIATDTDGGTGSGTHVKGQTLDGKLTIGMYHMASGSLRVKAGDTVSAGTPLGTEGSTGNVTGRHTHIEFFTGKFDDPWVPVNPTTDPLPILKEKGVL
ncbi:M23 family metallopeptidase [Pseudarthrobacter sp. PS3-L1]|uniref:M23 family metallopeptidase n=1 Tax=Pseudarthrobacter sp. PS3-L1 TaxID=3046207 RepID=UPI0032D8D06E